MLHDNYARGFASCLGSWKTSPGLRRAAAEGFAPSFVSEGLSRCVLERQPLRSFKLIAVTPSGESDGFHRLGGTAASMNVKGVSKLPAPGTPFAEPEVCHPAASCGPSRPSSSSAIPSISMGTGRSPAYLRALDPSQSSAWATWATRPRRTGLP